MTLLDKIKNFFSKNIDKFSVLLTVLFHSDKSILTFIIVILILYIIYKNNLYKFLESKESLDDITDDIFRECENSENIKSIEKSEESKNQEKNIDIEIKKTSKKSNNPYDNNVKNMYNIYNNECDNKDFKMNINNGVLTTPIFNLRKVNDLNFY